jgi:hypothetical protein
MKTLACVVLSAVLCLQIAITGEWNPYATSSGKQRRDDRQVHGIPGNPNYVPADDVLVNTRDGSVAVQVAPGAFVDTRTGQVIPGY